MSAAAAAHGSQSLACDPLATDSNPVVAVARRRHYTLSLEQSHGCTYVHAGVTHWSRAVARQFRVDLERIWEMHGGPLYATSHEPHGDDHNKFRKFVLLFGFQFFCTVTVDGVRHSVYVRDKCQLQG